MKYLDKAIAEDANYANAWFYEKLVYIERNESTRPRSKKY